MSSYHYICTRGRCACGRGINKGATTCHRCRRVSCGGCGKPTKLGRCHTCAWYSSNGISPKRLSIRSIITENPCLTLREVGDAVGVTGEYVRQVVSSEGLERYRYARLRGKPTMSGIPNPPCLACGKLMSVRNPKIQLHRGCRKIEVSCATCGHLFRKSASLLILQRNAGRESTHYARAFYCSVPCRQKGIWTSRRAREPQEPNGG